MRRPVEDWDAGGDLFIYDLPEAPERKYGPAWEDDTGVSVRNANEEEEQEEMPTVDHDEWELNRKYLFDDLDRYYYYCEFVDGYVDAHGLRGVRDRNERLLKALKEADNADRQTRIIWELVENNRPLARREAMRMYSICRWDEEDMRDAYEDSLLLLAQTYLKKIDTLRACDVKELGYLNFYTFKHACWVYNYKLERLREAGVADCRTLDEEDPDILPDEFLNVDQDGLLDAMGVLTPRERQVFLTYLFGNPVLNGVPYGFYDSQDIGEAVDLTRARVTQIIQKCLRKLHRNNRRYGLRDRIFSVDAQYAYGLEDLRHKGIRKIVTRRLQM